MSNPFDFASAQAAGNAYIFTIVLRLCYVILAIVTGLSLYACWRFRARPGQGAPEKKFGLSWLENAWTITPVLVMAGMFSLTVTTVMKTDPPAPRTPEIIVIGHQWWWEFRYPAVAAATANELHIPVGRNLPLRIQAADVIHDFAVVELARKMDAIPGYWNYMWLAADKAGTYPGACNEYCGPQHAWMRFAVIAEAPATYEAWLANQAEPARAPADAEEERGLELYKNLSCVNCHAIRGVSNKSNIGPDLTHVGSRRTLAAGLLTNNDRSMFLWLKNPQAQKPSVLMPNLQLTDENAHALAAYLEGLK